MGVASEGPHFLKQFNMEHSTPHCETFNIQYRYCDERDYRLHACGISTLEELRYLVSSLAGFAGIEDIRITYDTCYTEFKQYSL